MKLRYFFSCAFFCVAIEATKGTSYKYKFTYATYVGLEDERAKDELQTSPRNNSYVHICQLGKEEKIQICKGALLDPISVTNEIYLLDDIPVLKQRSYEIRRSGFEYTQQPPIKIEACMCPTNPPLYLCNNSTSGKDVDIYVSLRDKLADVVGPFPDEA